MVTVYSPLTWGIYEEPPPDIPECGFIGEFCLPAVRGKSPTLMYRRTYDTGSSVHSLFQFFALFVNFITILIASC